MSEFKQANQGGFAEAGFAHPKARNPHQYPKFKRFSALRPAGGGPAEFL